MVPCQIHQLHYLRPLLFAFFNNQTSQGLAQEISIFKIKNLPIKVFQSYETSWPSVAILQCTLPATHPPRNVVNHSTDVQCLLALIDWLNGQIRRHLQCCVSLTLTWRLARATEVAWTSHGKRYGPNYWLLAAQSAQRICSPRNASSQTLRDSSIYLFIFLQNVILFPLFSCFLSTPHMTVVGDFPSDFLGLHLN